MAMIQVTSARLKKAAQELQTLNGQFKSRAGELENSERALCGMWEGEAKAAFHNAFARDCVQMEAFYKLIGMYAGALSEIAEQYERAEARNIELAGSRKY